MSFNITKYFRNHYINELKENEWETLSDLEKKQYAKDIFNLISNSYSNIGGHPNYSSPTDVYNSEGDSNYKVIDIDGDDDIDAVKVTKTKKEGEKSVAMVHNGTSEAKRAVITLTALMLRKPGNYIEVSGKLKDILIAKNVPIIEDEETIKKILKGKEITFNSDGTYNRNINGKIFTKTLMGIPF